MQQIVLDYANLAEEVKWSVTFAILVISYFILASITYFLLYNLFKEEFSKRKIQKNYAHPSLIWHELKYTLSTLVIFIITVLLVFLASNKGYTLMYSTIESYGLAYFIASIFIIIFIHDAYFYWTHRFMHLPKVFPIVHKVHHQSTNPSPWSSFSFHPLEAIIMSGIMPLIVFTVPVHGLAYTIFIYYMLTMNILGHLGFEFYPQNFSGNCFGKWHITSTHHNIHHQHFKSNFGIYFSFWDKLMKTELK